MHVESLMSQLGEAQDLLGEKEDEIAKLQEHRHDYADEIYTLSQMVEKEQEIRRALEESHLGLEESYNLDVSKLRKDRDHALALAKVLKNEMVELGVGHARLCEDLEKLTKEH